MSSEAEFSESPAPQGPPPSTPSDMQMNGEGQPGNGQARNRRRRRKRKKNGSGPQANGEGQQAGGDIAASAEGEALPQQGSQNGQQSNQQNGQNQGQGQGQGKRWKKKRRNGSGGGGEFRPRPEPGNSIHADGGRRNNRQGKQRGPRQFVGPMDHMYREVNGNYADTPPSTIEMHGNMRRKNGHQRPFNEDRLPPELLTNARPVAIPEDAPTHIYFFVDDLFLTAKINESSRQQGVKVAFMKADKDVVTHLAGLHDQEHPSLIVVDLDKAATKPLTLIPKLKTKLKKGTSIIGFLNHLQTGDLKMKAMEAGCNTVMAKSAFSQNLPNLLRRYGVQEEEQNFNM